MKKYLCIDIGGTAIKYSVYNELGESDIAVKSALVQQTSEGTEIMDNVVKIVSDTLERETIAGICISSAGVVDATLGKVIYSGYTIPNYTGTPIKAILEEKFAIPCEVENDVNCACLGEYWLGAGRNSSSLICLTVGTGVGGAIMLEDRLVHGYSHTAGEIGYMTILGENFQDLASTSSLIKRVAERKNKEEAQGLTGYKVFELAKKGDIVCIEEIDNMVKTLALGITNLLYLFNPETLILGGGIMGQKEMLKEKIDQAVAETIIDPMFNKTTIKFAQKGNDAGLLGALYHFKNKNS
ncbi:ROK family protein [Carnobacterium sp. TMP28]|uniref:ROK family protein n=1 Tax=Carnobacterium sp. TMP28 TaxID=3397060 RepID=UPI0039DFF3EB